MEKFADRLCKALEIKNMSAAELSRKSGIDEGTISNYKKGKYAPKQKKLEMIANSLNVPIAWLMGANIPMTAFNAPDITEEYIEYPVIGDVAAGYEKIAIEDWTGDTIKIPPDFLNGRKRNDYFVLRVTGDSMYPAYIENDKVLVLKQNTLDYSGQVAIVLYDDENGTIKKVENTPDVTKLIPINPQYAPKIIDEAVA